MWTATHQRLDITVIVLVNSRYATLNTALHAFTGQTSLDAFSLDRPAIGFAHLAQAYGWNYACIETMEALHCKLAELPTQGGGNTLLEVRLDPQAVPITTSEHF
ncbi:MAG TPA: thiamine pyrophosphate-dependent enzyme, partial [Ktedonobacteraceae bacterium]|nr:thiamine pyrophosphate-dependent enzyme [Ktedonobacteraceae bacterium]